MREPVSWPEPELDAVLLGLVILEHPLAAAVTDEWLEAPRWRKAAQILLRHRRTGGRLGDLITAGRVLARAHCDLLLCDVDPEEHVWARDHRPHAGGSGLYLPLTTAAEAVCAVADAASATAAIGQAGARLVRLALRRLACRCGTLAGVAPGVMFAAFASLRDAMARIEALDDRYRVTALLESALESDQCVLNDDLDGAVPAAFTGSCATTPRGARSHRIAIW